MPNMGRLGTRKALATVLTKWYGVVIEPQVCISLLLLFLVISVFNNDVWSCISNECSFALYYKKG
jgi:hypothetical protein